MKVNVAYQVKVGGRISYNDGGRGHQNVEATVLEVDREGMRVQFDDRADTTYIRFSDRAWMDFIDVAG
jgi:sRNA-binding protein